MARLKNIELIKNIAILFVVLNHCMNPYTGLWVYTSTQNSTVFDFIARYIGSFHRALFVFCSGYIYFYKMNKRNEVLTHATPFLANQPLHERSYFFWNYRLAIGMNNLEIVMMNSPNIWYGVLKKRGGEILLSESYHSNLLTIKKKTVYTKNIA